MMTTSKLGLVLLLYDVVSMLRWCRSLWHTMPCSRFSRLQFDVNQTFGELKRLYHHSGDPSIPPEDILNDARHTPAFGTQFWYLYQATEASLLLRSTGA